MNMRSAGPKIEGRCSNLGSISFRSGARVDLGSCNLCKDIYCHHVTEITGAGLALRVCDSCLRKIQEWRPTIVKVQLGGMQPAETFLRVGDRFTQVKRVVGSNMIQCRYDAEGDIVLSSANSLIIDDEEHPIGDRIKQNTSGLYCFYLKDSDETI